jgi:hypothetical protein
MASEVGINTNMFPASVGAYRDRLKHSLTTAVYQYFFQMYQAEYRRVVQFMKENGQRPHITDVLRAFQGRLAEIPKWNTDQIHEAVVAIEKLLPDTSRHNEILKILFVSESMLLASIRTTGSVTVPDLPVQVPTLDQYLHRVLYLVGRNLYDFPSMVRVRPEDDEQTAAKNKAYMIKCIHNGILGAISDLLPVHHIMDKYLNDTIRGLHFKPDDEQLVPTTAEPAPAAPESVETAAPEAPAAAVETPSEDTDAPEPVQAAPTPAPAAAQAPIAPAKPPLEEYGFDDQSQGELTDTTTSDSESEESSDSEDETSASEESEESEDEKKRRRKRVNLKQ